MNVATILVAFTILAPRIALAASTACPATNAAAGLSSIMLYDGPPEQKDDLTPDTTSRQGALSLTSWNIASIYALKRSAYVVCSYGASAPVTLKIDKATVCTRTIGAGKLTFICQ